MNFFRPAVDFARQIWFAIDTANALRHGAPVSDNARRYCMTAPDVAPFTAPSTVASTDAPTVASTVAA